MEEVRRCWELRGVKRERDGNWVLIKKTAAVINRSYEAFYNTTIRTINAQNKIMSLLPQILSTVIILILIVPSMSVASYNSKHLHQFSLYPHSFSVNEPSNRAAYRLSKNFIGDDGRVYACSGKNFFAFENNGSIAWTVHLNYTCNASIAPVHGGSTKAKNRVLKIFPLRVGTSEPAVEVFFGPSTEEIIGVSISNTLGELYSLSFRGPYFKWIQDFSSFGNKFTITPGNNGRMYVTIPDTAVILALDVSTGNILWRGNIGPLSSADYEPVVDANGWISFGSLDGFLYSFSPTGALKKFPRSGGLDNVIQVDPVLDCSGYAVYISRTEMEGKSSQTIGEYTHVSALKPRNVVFTLLAPASGSVYWSESDPSKFMLKLSQSDLQHFVLDERTFLAFYAVSRNGNPLPCRTTRQKLASSCSQVKPKNISIYTGNERTIILFLLIESVFLVLLAAFVRYCCIFWKKRKLQGLDLGKFLEKRRSLQTQQKTFDRMITELEQKASEEAVANEVLEKLSDLVKEREDIRRKLSTTYSLGTDTEVKSRSKSFLPLYDRKTRSYSFQGSKKESFTVFHTLSDSSTTDSRDGSSTEGANENLEEDNEFVFDAKGKGKARVEVESSSDDEIHEKEYSDHTTTSASRGVVNPLFLERSFSEIGEAETNDRVKVMGNRVGESRSLRRRTMSFTN
ncbi:hypothetical protein BUALT_Bualt04G0127700 [Buddleja alternifolia]|uniref:Protein GAMETE EXPRESSED 3 n=1 Tax=Buddleja alternifolia TaxID=168488 RepID=A0AAV6XWH7_9LAMI|nr:hypothetical protein BUALT_Bualt04G0127700 [Buddleja alternifolia]